MPGEDAAFEGASPRDLAGRRRAAPG